MGLTIRQLIQSIGGGGSGVFSIINSGELSLLASFSRASGGITETSPGVFAQAAVNEPRYRYVNGFKELLIEGAGTNLLLDSNSVATWFKNGTATISQTNLPDAFGGNTATEVNIAAAGDYVRTAATIGNGTTGTVSIYVKAANSGSSAKIRITTNNSLGWSSGISNIFTVTSSWQRISVTGVVQNGNATPFAYVIFGAVDAASGGDATCTGKVQLCFAQTEADTFASSYIPTTAAPATRAAEILSIPISALGWNASAGTLIFEGTPNDTAAGRIVSNRQAIAPSFLEIASAKAGSWDGTTAILTANSFTAGQAIKTAVAFDGSGRSVCLNGGAVVSGGALSYAGMTELQIGSAQNGVPPFFSGSIRNLQYYPRKLSNAELQATTS